MRVRQQMAARIPPASAVSPVLWFAVLGAPAAWIVQLGLGYWLAEAECSPTGGQWGISLQAWGIVVTALAAATAAAAGLTALALFRRDGDKDDPPPAGRIAFLAWVGLTVAALFLVLIAMTGAGILAFHVCNQS